MTTLTYSTSEQIVEDALSLLLQWKDVPVLDEDSAKWLGELFDGMENNEQRLRVFNQYPLRFFMPRTDRDRPWEKLYYLKCDTMPYSWQMSRFMFAVSSWNPNPR